MQIQHQEGLRLTPPPAHTTTILVVKEVSTEQLEVHGHADSCKYCGICNVDLRFSHKAFLNGFDLKYKGIYHIKDTVLWPSITMGWTKR